MKHTRREFLATAGAAGAACMFPAVSQADERPSVTKNHIVTLSFDDGFKNRRSRQRRSTKSTSCRPAST